MAEASGVVELDDEVVLQFIERKGLPQQVRKTRSDLNIMVSCIPHSCSQVRVEYGEIFHECVSSCRRVKI
jgi:hypothetical protein